MVRRFTDLDIIDFRRPALVPVLRSTPFRSALHIGPSQLKGLVKRRLDVQRLSSPWRLRGRQPASERAVVHWLGPGVWSRFHLWWVCHAFRESEQVHVVPMATGLHEEDWLSYAYQPAEYADRASARFELSSKQREELAANWSRWWSGEWPEEVRFPRATAWVGTVPQTLRDFWPRESGGRTLPSVFDTRVLTALGPSFESARVVLIRALRSHSHAMLWGDAIFCARLAAWSRCRDPWLVVQRERAPAGAINRLDGWRYRRTPLSRRLLRDGVDDVRRLPGFVMGGFGAWGPLTPARR